jgi:hypothetical protein
MTSVIKMKDIKIALKSTKNKSGSTPLLDQIV